jgi:putative DNA primase/helicase
MLSLLPEHLADLRASGLADATIELMHVESVDPSDWLKSQGVQSAYRIPYLQLKDCPPFYRDKIFPPLGGRKYDQSKGGGCRLYVLEPVVDLLQDFTKPIYFVEGEKKAAAGYQAGLGCVVGVGGIWNFLDKVNGELIPEFDRIAWRNREIFYIPDSDVWARRDLQQACFEFGTKIRERGGLRFYFIQLPPKAAS